MSQMGDTTENAVMALIFNATAWANYADNAATSPQTQIAVGLHTADPGDSGTMSTSEITYTSYARAAVNRNSGGWTVTGGSVSPAANIDFVTGTGGSGTATHFTAGKTGGGAAAYIARGAISPTIVSGNGVTPRLNTSTAISID